MKAGDLVKITKEFGAYWQDCADGQFNCAGMAGIFLQFNEWTPYGNTATVWFFNGYVCEIDAPHVWVEVINESR